jgi:hypothetical protein
MQSAKANDPFSTVRNWKPPKLSDIEAGFDKAIAATPRKREKLYIYKSKGSTRYTNVPGAQRGER